MQELMIELNNKNKTPYYEQIYEFIKNEIRNGQIPCGEKLPSSRLLAGHLSVSRSTVELAYAQLISEGYIESIPYRGYYVSEISLLYDLGVRNDPDHMPDPQPVDSDRIDFSPWGIDLEYFPFNTWRKISKGLLSADNKELFASTHSKGELCLRKSICQYLFEARGVRCRPENVIIGAGNEVLLTMINRLFDESPVVAMENPTYIQAYRVFKQNGSAIRLIDTDRRGMVVSELMETDARLVYVMPSHQFPMGTVMPINRRMQLIDWAGMEENRYIIEDDYDSEFRYIGKPIPSLQGVDHIGRVIYMGTFSKSIAPSIRMSYMVLPDSLMQRYEERVAFYSPTVSKIDQLVVSEFIDGGYFGRHLNKMRSVYRAKHDQVISMLKTCGKKVKVSGENAGLHLIVTLDQRINEEKMVAKALEAGVLVYPLSDYYIHQQNVKKSTVLIGFASLSPEEIREGIQRLIKAWKL